MNGVDVLRELYGRLPELVAAAVDGVSPEQLAAAPAPGANTVGWLVWHLTRVQDAHLAELLGEEQEYVTGRWAPRFGLDADAGDTGYGHGPDDVLAVRPESAQVLVDHYAAVAARTEAYLVTVTDADLEDVVDEHWDPPVTRGARLVSVAEDDLQHAGQAAFVRGLLGS